MTVTRLRVAAVTHPGRLRPRNEDCITIGGFLAHSAMVEPYFQSVTVNQPIVCMVADGLGGHVAGDYASQFACERLQRLLDVPDIDLDIVCNGLKQVHSELYRLMEQTPALRGMGATVAGLVVLPDKCFGFNLGDSRIYRLRGEYLAQLSTDDSAVDISSRAITQCLGGTETHVQVVPHVFEEQLKPEQAYLLCSDGLTEMLTVDEMESLISTDSQACVENLFSKAMAKGGVDNISIVYVRILCHEMPSTQREPTAP